MALVALDVHFQGVKLSACVWESQGAHTEGVAVLHHFVVAAST